MSVQTEESLLTFDEVLEASRGIHVLGSGDFYFSSVQTDSRNVKKDTFFIPLIGQFQDGHNYIPQALEQGAGVVFICLKNYEDNPDFFTGISLKNPNVFFIAVENTLTALQNIAARYVEKFPDLIKIGITGSSGKTTTKEIAAAILRQKYNLVTNAGNLNSETGLPLSVFNIRREHQLGIFEMGMNRHNEMAEIAGVLKPRFALITNIGSAHIGMLGSRQGIAEEKSKIFSHFKGIGTAFIPKDDDFADYLSEQVDGNVVYYGNDCDDQVKFIEDLGLEGTRFSVCGKEMVLSLPGKYNFKNALAALSLARFFNMTPEEISDGIQNMKSLFGRSQIVRGRYTVIQDCYNANPDSMEKAIDFVSNITGSQQKILILGDMRELGSDSEKEHENIGLEASKSGAAFVFFVGDEMSAAYKAADKSSLNTKFFYFSGDSLETMKDTAAAVKKVAKDKDIILVKGSRGMALERVINLLEENA